MENRENIGNEESIENAKSVENLVEKEQLHRTSLDFTHENLEKTDDNMIEIDNNFFLDSNETRYAPVCEGIKIGDMAPDFTADTTLGKLSLKDLKGRWVVLFSHPGDFTPVCTTEIVAFSKYHNEFKKRDCELVGLSVDSNSSHIAWLDDIYRHSGVQVPFPIISDRDMKIAEKYQMISPNANKAATVRSVYFIDPSGIIKVILTYPMNIGRNIPEIIRIVDALQKSEYDKVSTPVNWIPGAPAIIPSPTTFQEVMENSHNPQSSAYINWYLCFENKDMFKKQNFDLNRNFDDDANIS